MNRSYARIAVYSTLKNLGVEITSLPKKRRIAHVLDADTRLDFVKQLNQKMPGARKLSISKLAVLTVGQVVTVLASMMPGDDLTMWSTELPGGFTFDARSYPLGASVEGAALPGDDVTMLSAEMPGDDKTKGRRNR